VELKSMRKCIRLALNNGLPKIGKYVDVSRQTK